MTDKDMVLANSKVKYQMLLEEEVYAVTKTTVLAGGETQWHRHTNVNDRFVVVCGVLTVECQVDGVVSKAEVRDYFDVKPGVSHHVKNETDDDVVYIMVQSGGKRDIVLELAGTPAEARLVRV
ncbi:cupin domain-containing protein [Bradyrhizobium prioriisuperbiae]|uniref:cupin domain-containing protein n=1 Tax=Bradyrhizobium prioriisuperbiae TaxID=2854389 RepID=UPI0028E971C6|nr:cupin domain-containing protein [Bradyrhizobium prioritasuperba]